MAAANDNDTEISLEKSNGLETGIEVESKDQEKTNDRSIDVVSSQNKNDTSIDVATPVEQNDTLSDVDDTSEQNDTSKDRQKKGSKIIKDTLQGWSKSTMKGSSKINHVKEGQKDRKSNMRDSSRLLNRKASRMSMESDVETSTPKTGQSKKSTHIAKMDIKEKGALGSKNIFKKSVKYAMEENNKVDKVSQSEEMALSASARESAEEANKVLNGEVDNFTVEIKPRLNKAWQIALSKMELVLPTGGAAGNNKDGPQSADDEQMNIILKNIRSQMEEEG